MLKKSFFITLIIFPIIGMATYFSIPVLGLKMITDYEPYTFEKVLNSPDLRENYGINGFDDPADYGFEFHEIQYKSLDNTALSGWYIPAKNPSPKTLVFIHGRTSNRLKTMKYLAAVDSFDLDQAYNIFIPDLRNSGRSAASKTYMGYKFGEDLAASLLFLKRQFGQDAFFLYGFSMGAMAICNTLGRDDLSSIIAENQITVESVIFDSPLVNVKENLKTQAEAVPLLSFLFDPTFDYFSDEIHGFGESMRMSILFPPHIPLLILQSNDDRTTPKSCLLKELEQTGHFTNLTIEYFDGPGHVQLYQDARSHDQYMRALENFLRKHDSSAHALSM